MNSSIKTYNTIKETRTVKSSWCSIVISMPKSFMGFDTTILPRHQANGEVLG